MNEGGMNNLFGLNTSYETSENIVQHCYMYRISQFLDVTKMKRQEKTENMVRWLRRQRQFTCIFRVYFSELNLHRKYSRLDRDKGQGSTSLPRQSVWDVSLCLSTVYADSWLRLILQSSGSKRQQDCGFAPSIICSCWHNRTRTEQLSSSIDRA